MSALLITETKNTRRKTPPFRLKADGDEFSRECDKCFSHWAIDENISDLMRVECGDENKVAKKKKVLNSISTMSGLDRIAFFCHGWQNGISLGFTTIDVPELAAAIANVCEPVLHIALFACLTGRGQFWRKGKSAVLSGNVKNYEDRFEKVVTAREGFAMLLCSELNKLGIDAHITAHLTSGHTTRNPLKVRISPVGELITRIRIQDTKPRRQWAEWVDKLATNPTYRFDVAVIEEQKTLTIESIRDILADN